MCIASDFLSIGEVFFGASLGRLDLLGWVPHSPGGDGGSIRHRGRSIGRSIGKSQ